MKYLNLTGLNTLLGLLKSQWGYKSVYENNKTIRNQYLLNIDYAADLAFNTDQIVGDAAAPYVGTAVVGSTYVA